MKLASLRATGFRSLRDVTLELHPLNLLIGPNAAGKSSVLDALKFLSEAVRNDDFAQPVSVRGGILHLAWKGAYAHAIGLDTHFQNGDASYRWSVRLDRADYDFVVRETITEERSAAPPRVLLDAVAGKGWWWSEETQTRIRLELEPTACAVGKAAANVSFPARQLADFVGGWAFFDPSPPFLRRASDRDDCSRLDQYGRNLAARLHAVREQSPQVFARIVAATHAVLGYPDQLDLRDSDDGRTYFVQTETGLRLQVHQIGASSGTLRVLALVTALLGESGAALVGIEEPENHVHPSAIRAFAELLREAATRLQVLVTTHSPPLLDTVGDPAAVCVVRRTETGTEMRREQNPDGVAKALQESGFGLGEFHETKGFGA